MWTGATAVMNPSSFKPTQWSPLVFLIYQLVVIGILLVVMLEATGGDGAPPAYNWNHVVPLWVPWAGALGGSTISLVGVAGNSNEWDGPRYAYWHLARPVLGMITGTVAVLVLLFVLKGIAPGVIPEAGDEYDAGGVAVMFVIAFVVGYREETFRELVKRVVDVLLGPGDKAATQRVALVPGVLSLVHTQGAAGAPITDSMTLLNDTKDTFDIATATLSITGQEFAVAWADDTPLAPSATRAITVTWTPAAGSATSEQTVSVGIGGYRVTALVRAEVR